jgi:Rieske Fe-S protein
MAVWSMPPSHPDTGRRRVLATLCNAIAAAIGGTLAALLGVFAIRPAAAQRRERWVRAGLLTDLTPNTPVARALAIPRVDGWYRTRARETVMLLWDGGSEVRAFSAVCTHLGCQVRWNGEARQFQCPCHGGAYDAEGRVVAGPPPRPLDTIATRVDPSQGTVLVEL